LLDIFFYFSVFPQYIAFVGQKIFKSGKIINTNYYFYKKVNAMNHLYALFGGRPWN